MPLGMTIHSIEITHVRDGQLSRSAGAIAKLIAKEGKLATLRLPYEEVHLVSQNCLATVEQAGNVVMNTVDHPMAKGKPLLVEKL